MGVNGSYIFEMIELSMVALFQYGTTEKTCGCAFFRQQGLMCQHMHRLHELLRQIEQYSTTLSHHGRPYCGCREWQEYVVEECEHITALHLLAYSAAIAK